MSLPWVRLDTGIASHDKILSLLADPSPKRFQAAFSYVCALAWCGDHGTDGYVPATALAFVHGSKATASLLERYELWDSDESGWDIRNYAERQQMSVVTEAMRSAKKRGGRKGNCIRHHGPACGCWKDADQ